MTAGSLHVATVGEATAAESVRMLQGSVQVLTGAVGTEELVEEERAGPLATAEASVRPPADLEHPPAGVAQKTAEPIHAEETIVLIEAVCEGVAEASARMAEASEGLLADLVRVTTGRISPEGHSTRSNAT